MRLAFYSPLNPIATGIADYAEELLPLLAREFEITLVVDHYRPSNPALAAFPLLSPEAFKSKAKQFDLVVYQMGNSPVHDAIYRTLIEVPGVVVLHDTVLHHLRAWQTVDRRDTTGYVEAMRADFGEAGAELARYEALGLAALNRFDFPLNGSVARAARALIVHSEYAAHQLQPTAPATPIAVVPMGVPALAPLPAARARARLGLAPGAFIAAAFGEVHPHKRVTVALQAFAEFHHRRPDSLFVLVGRESPNYAVDDLIRLLGLADAVRRVGFAPREEYEDYIAAADLCLNLRYPTAGESSASLLRLFSAGKAVVVTRTGAYADLPPGVCAFVEADGYEQDLLTAQFDLFAQRPDLAAQLGANARAFALECHTLEQSAAAYAEFLRAVAANTAASKSYLVPWSGPAAGPAMPIVAPPTETTPGPTLPPPVVTSLLDAVALACAELGLAEDTPSLRDLAAALVELGLEGPDV